MYHPLTFFGAMSDGQRENRAHAGENRVYLKRFKTVQKSCCLILPCSVSATRASCIHFFRDDLQGWDKWCIFARKSLCTITMTRESADYWVYYFAKLQGYKFDNEHYFEFRGVWKKDGVVSYVYRYVEPPYLLDGNFVPTGNPIYWECCDIHIGWIRGNWSEFEDYMQSTKQ